MVMNYCDYYFRNNINPYTVDRRNNSDVIEEGSLVEFSVVSCNQSGGVYFLHGSDVVV